jgi:hypothetical protein
MRPARRSTRRPPLPPVAGVWITAPQAGPRVCLGSGLCRCGRARALLRVLGVSPASKSASGRYLRSLPILPGVRYWTTSQVRLEQDFVGVQFFGEGADEASRCGRRLEHAGFRQRTPQTGQTTFAKPLRFAHGQAIDTQAVRAIKRELDSILFGDEIGTDQADGDQPQSFRDFMLASPLADLDLDLPSRDADWRQGGF